MLWAKDKQLKKEFSRALSRFDRGHGQDLEFSVLSAFLTTLFYLVLHYIRSLHFRLMTVILVTLTFSVVLSLPYKPKWGEVFTITAPFAVI